MTTSASTFRSGTTTMRWLGTCRLAIGGLIFMAVTATTLSAGQTHPCDQALPATTTIASGAPYRVQFCSPQSDSPEALLATVDNTPYDLVPVAAKTQPSATGQVLYESNVFIQVAKGQHQLIVALYNRDGSTGQLQLGAASSPFAFSAADQTPKAGAPKVVGIVK